MGVSPLLPVSKLALSELSLPSNALLLSSTHCLQRFQRGKLYFTFFLSAMLIRHNLSEEPDSYKNSPFPFRLWKKKQQTQEKKRGQLSQWLSGQKELLAAEHLWKNALLRSVNENGIFLKIWIQLGTIGTSKFGPLCFLKYLALKWAKSEVTFQKPPAFIPPYSQVALKILVVLMSSIMLKPVGKKRTHFSWLNAQVSSRHCFNNRLIRKFPNYLYCLRMLKERMLFLNFSITIK